MIIPPPTIRRFVMGRSSLSVWLASSLLAAPLCVLVLPAKAAEDVASCRRAIAKVAASFAKTRVNLISRCEDANCDPTELAAKLARLDERSQRRLAARCTSSTRTDVGLGSTCPDPSGRCTQTLDSDQALIDCVLCMVRETVDPMLRRLRGSLSDVAETCGGCSATPCEGEYFCETRPGHCDDDTSVGVCLEVPTACPDIFDPVCACNRQTYDNDCLRQQAHVALFHEGPCMTFCEGDSGSTCPDGTTCEGLPGHCDATTAEGICVPVPTDCGDDERPLCGCDDVTYANECELLAAGARLDHLGPCEEIGCFGDEQCGEGLFCELPPETCDRVTDDGICIARPEACIALFDPVCGCDGVTYGNDCERQRSGVPVAHRGACDRICGGIAGVLCPTGERCELPSGECEVADLQGHCVEALEICPDYYEPVCGCDGVTYSNNCERQLAGGQLAHFGVCFEACVPGSPDACGAEEVCVTPPGLCDLTREAECVPRPVECAAEEWPVCGCDGATYPSPCEAIRAGVAIADEGPC
jgi:hypothetical protein